MDIANYKLPKDAKIELHLNQAMGTMDVNEREGDGTLKTLETVPLGSPRSALKATINHKKVDAFVSTGTVPVLVYAIQVGTPSNMKTYSLSDPSNPLPGGALIFYMRTQKNQKYNPDGIDLGTGLHNYTVDPSESYFSNGCERDYTGVIKKLRDKGLIKTVYEWYDSKNNKKINAVEELTKGAKPLLRSTNQDPTFITLDDKPYSFNLRGKKITASFAPPRYLNREVCPITAQSLDSKGTFKETYNCGKDDFSADEAIQEFEDAYKNLPGVKLDPVYKQKIKAAFDKAYAAAKAPGYNPDSPAPQAQSITLGSVE